MASPAPAPPHRPGSVSLFFVAKAAVFAAGFWIWLAIMTIGGGPASGLETLAATCAVTTTLVSVVLGARMALQHNAAERHAELKRLLVDISWNAFAAAGNSESVANVVPFRTAAYDPTSATTVSRIRDNGDERRR